MNNLTNKILKQYGLKSERTELSSQTKTKLSLVEDANVIFAEVENYGAEMKEMIKTILTNYEDAREKMNAVRNDYVDWELTLENFLNFSNQLEKKLNEIEMKSSELGIEPDVILPNYFDMQMVIGTVDENPFDDELLRVVKF